jgi:Cu+-exporting ATPase
MRLADYIEHFTVTRARSAVRDLTTMAPETARVERDAAEVDVPVSELRVGETVIVRPGEMIPVDGEVIAGHATVNQAAITGESIPAEAGPGARVFAASFAQLGHLRVRVTGIGADTTFGRVIKLVEQADQHRAEVQRLADRFATWYLPIVAVIAATTFLVSGNALATAAVLMVACSCSFALATPVAMIASIGASARRGLLIKGSRYLESLAKADVVLIDKTAL